METHELCHAKDPQTSFDAADKLIKSGELNQQESDVYDKIMIHVFCFKKESFTAGDLAAFSALDYHLIQRRLSGLKSKGKIERTGERRNGGCVWRLTEKEDEKI